ncbi:lipopolysaccharide biosynthesis protein [Zobellia russellii]|uniref:lipopolysaccharide biosynthesis protein n=1 Tax=Zobellia russellii TaxID=248907 RepID=UPI001BFF082C|nr:polysaccharide biosynthesis C-terminal domain-containing protein [Zobellia russellii]MBT9187524.1 polysaccharide biosynthesis C-terminal domain-containing protein [Zobellia russellii]
MSLKKRVLSNGLASVFQKGVRVLEQLFLVPFFISAWGAAYYGEWLTLTIIPSVIAFSNLGFGSAAANSFVLSYAANQKQEAANISKTGVYIISIMVLVAMLISTVAIFTLDYFHVFDKSLIDSKEAILAVSILIFSQLLTFYLQLIEAYYRAAERAALSINLLTFKAAANLGAGLLVLLLGYGIVEFAISQLLVMLVFMVFYWIKGRQVIGLFKIYSGQKDKVILKSITTKGLSYLMLPVWQIIYFQGTTFVVRIVLGPEAVAIFNTVRTLSRSLNQLLYLVEPTVFPELINQIGKGDWKTAQKIFRLSILGVFILSAVGFVFLALFGLWFYGVWTNHELEVPKTMWYLFISGMLLNALWYTTEMVFRAVNEPRKMGVYGLVGALVSVGLTYLLSLQFGLTGAAMGAISLDLILVVLVMPEGCKLMRMSLKELYTHGLEDLQTLGVQARHKLQSIRAKV